MYNKATLVVCAGNNDCVETEPCILRGLVIAEKLIIFPVKVCCLQNATHFQKADNRVGSTVKRRAIKSSIFFVQ